MEEVNFPKCSRDSDQTTQERNKETVATMTTPQKNASYNEPSAPSSFSLLKSNSNYSLKPNSNYSLKPKIICQSHEVPLVLKASNQIPITTQPRISTLPSPMSIATFYQPQTLFLQALSKLSENPLAYSILTDLQSNILHIDWKAGDVSPPDSLTNAPPSYSFVLRQMAARRRPRLMGTFIPSPSFVQHTPPPTYATAFDIYIDSGPPPPPRVYSYGFTSMPVVCPECGYTGMTATTCKVTICTHLCAVLLCLFCCWICAPLPYVLRSCKDVYHYCRNCRTYLGMYCPTNPESTYTTR